MSTKKVVAMKIGDLRKSWKGERISLQNVIAGFFDLERKGEDYWSKAIKFVVANNLNTLEKFEKEIEIANNAACQTEMDNRLVLATTEEEIKAIRIEFIHQKTTKQHTEGTFKTSILPNAWRSAVSVIGTALSMGIPLLDKVRHEGVIIDYKPMPKSVLDKLIKAQKEGTDGDTGDSPVDEDSSSTTGSSEDKSDKRPIDKLEVLVHSMRHVLAEIEDPQELEIAKRMVESVWDLTPFKIAAEA